MPAHATVEQHLNAIEAEMRNVRLWQDQPLTAEQMKFTQAFGMDTMSFDQWLQFIFIPRVRQIVDSKGNFPRASNVGAQAVREFDGNDEAAHLVHLLCEFDALFR